MANRILNIVGWIGMALVIVALGIRFGLPAQDQYAFYLAWAGLVCILARSVVGYADRLLVGLRDARLIDQKINNEVDVIAAGACCERSKYSDRVHFTSQRVE